jgi:hypothetical protein
VNAGVVSCGSESYEHPVVGDFLRRPAADHPDMKIPEKNIGPALAGA